MLSIINEKSATFQLKKKEEQNQGKIREFAWLLCCYTTNSLIKNSYNVF
jgi:hypothetical protein